MKILAADFIRSCVSPKQFPRDGLPELAFVGRSNVGKSTLINSLLNRKRLAKVSRTPGKTRVINYFKIQAAGPLSRGFYVVDLPGYGYAKVSKSIRAEWEPLLEEYVTQRQPLRGILLLIDARRGDTDDSFAWEWFQQTGKPVVVIVTKIDKLSRSERTSRIRTFRKTLDLSDRSVLVPYSSVTHEGREELWRIIRDLLTRE